MAFNRLSIDRQTSDDWEVPSFLILSFFQPRSSPPTLASYSDIKILDFWECLTFTLRP